MTSAKKIDGATVSYNDDQQTKDAVFEKLLAWFFEQESFFGESIIQNDSPTLGAPVLLSDIADDILQFNIDWEDE